MNKQYGISLIEVLISVLIVSLGLLALAAFQGDLMSASGENKARSEAQSLAEDKVEELKNNIVKAGFDSALVDGTDTITGVNAEFTRAWTVTNGTLATQKLISVAVTWAGDSVSITNESLWYNPATGVVAAAAEDGAGTGALAPSPNNYSSTLGGESRLSTSDGTQLGDASDATDPLRKFWVASDSEGRQTIYYDGETSAALTCNGDVVLEFSGTVFSINSLTGKGIDISQVGLCYLDTANATTVTGFNSARYACVACGNCEDSPGVNGCPASPNPYNSIGPGGWRGKIGLRGVGDTAGNQEQVCFNEQILDADAGASTGREYTTHRTDSGTESSEGINTPYECHDFLIMNRSGPNSSCATGASALSASTNIAPKKFTRELNGDTATAPNTVLALDSTYCNLAPSGVTLAGEITLVQTGGTAVNINKITLAMDAAGSCDTLSTNSPGTYTINCTATTVAADVTISISTTQSGAVITPQSSYTVTNAANAAAFAFTVTK